MPGRPEKPIAPDRSSDLQALAAQLRELRAASGLSLQALAARTSASPSALSRASSGRVMPSWQSVSAFADAAQLDAVGRAELARRWERARSSAGRGVAAGVESPAHMLGNYHRDADRSALLGRLYAAAGRPSLRQLAEQSRRSRSTVHRAVTGRSLAGANELAEILLSYIPQEHRSSWADKVDVVFESPSAAAAPPLFKIKAGGSARQAEQAVAEFRRALRVLRNLAVHGQIELDPQLAVQVMQLDTAFEEAALPDPGSATSRALQALEASEHTESSRDRRIS
ncbi:helix-turn-helix domain-containing protein [Streptomyces montanisoli]|uniref:Helix-turn-helix domain-containing protein n=1 Tax=Streptomyces montanisoli TaxID=2798581 RepID=A0A940MCI7_9ACTN|nr:helix-turn-helix transcriptional regulator [Streptomyces montanisoli]MBP0460470.1 helix-turn-helix domain-containing protein [Streptomyces montanisoli]